MGVENTHCRDCQLRHHGRFNDLNPDCLDTISNNKTCNLYKKGQLLLHEGSRPMGVFCIKEGKVKVFKLGQQGKEQITAILKEGDLVGYRAMLGDSLYHVSVEALEDVVACHIPKSDFMSAFENDKSLHHKLINELSNEVMNLTAIITDLAQKPVRERTAAALVMLSDIYKNGSKDPNVPIDISLTRESLANIVGTATETLIRILHDFKEEGLVESKGRKLTVTNVKTLERVGGIY
ncbi:MAG: Crp/Fnr family transcriptional regulator [Cyclobacteriaceae bacterium]|nr:Crp/Fnr family transcriptional regulator [Cyclobacteriaceae bacterium]